MEIYTWENFSKRENETLQPNIVGASQIEVQLKDDCSLDSPIFILDGYIGNISYVKAWGRYYFVNSCMFLNGYRTMIQCTIDVLASYKGDIMSTTAYVLYDTTSNDKQLHDTRMNVSTIPSIANNSIQFRDDLTGVGKGSYLITVVGNDDTQVYTIPHSEIKKIIPSSSDYHNQIMSVFDISSITDLVSGFKKTSELLLNGGDIANNIRDVRWIPFQVSSGSSSKKIQVGFCESPAIGTPYTLDVTDRIKFKSTTISIPWIWEDWRQEANTSVSLYIPFIGTLAFSGQELRGADSFTVESSVDTITGDMSICLYKNVGANMVVMGTYSTSTACSIPIGNASNGIISKAGSALSSGIGSALSGNILGAVSGAVKDMSGGMTSTAGSLGSSSAYYLPKNLIVNVIQYDTSDTPTNMTSTLGTPEFKVKSLGSLSGYVQTLGASVSIPSESSVRERINSMLDSGIFLT